MQTQTKSRNNLSITKPGSSKYPVIMNELSKRMLLAILSDLKKGILRLDLSDSESMYFGDPAVIDSYGASENKQDCPLIKVVNDDFFSRCILFADLGLAESYLDGDCKLENIRLLISWFLLNAQDSTVLNESKRRSRLLNLLGVFNKILHACRRNTKACSVKNISEHYDLGNEFFAQILDRTMTYSSALFSSDEQSLAAAQEAKYERICRQLRLEKGMSVLEIGCGWGGFALYAAQNYGVNLTLITISKQQYDYVGRLIKDLHLEKQIDLRLMDYRKLNGSYDRIVSIEMIEAVGEEYIDQYAAKLDQVLKQDGLILLQFIACPDSRYETLKSNVDFIQKHIFPGSLLQSQHRVNLALRKSGELFPVDLFDMTESYVRTLSLWQKNFEDNWQNIAKLGCDERFKRKWIYYFQYCQAAFAMRNISLIQVLYSRPNNLALNREYMDRSR